LNPAIRAVLSNHSFDELLHFETAVVAALLSRPDARSAPSDSYDVAAFALEVAVRMPGCESLDVAAHLKWVDDAAALVRFQTERHMYRFWRNPAGSNNSEAEYRLSWLVTVLQRDLGVRYRMESVELSDEDFFRDPDNLFIHAIIQGKGGTCSSLPFLFAAVGRRLGYPLKIVPCKRHLFIRWEGEDGERVNVESTSQGYVPHDDDYYMNWPFPTTPEEVQREGFLKSLLPHEEVSALLGQRGVLYFARGQYGDAVQEYLRAYRVAPDMPRNLFSVEGALGRWGQELRGRLMPGFPGITMGQRRKIHPGLPFDTDAELMYCSLLEMLLNHPPYEEQWWRPMREAGDGNRPAGLPGWVEVTFSDDLKPRFREGRPPAPKPGA
jgi:hypothetical protein